MAAVLPEFLAPAQAADRFLCLPGHAGDAPRYQYRLAWNPRLLRLNPHATRQRDSLISSLTQGVISDHPSPPSAASRRRIRS